MPDRIRGRERGVRALATLESGACSARAPIFRTGRGDAVRGGGRHSRNADRSLRTRRVVAEPRAYIRTAGQSAWAWTAPLSRRDQLRDVPGALHAVRGVQARLRERCARGAAGTDRAVSRDGAGDVGGALSSGRAASAALAQ